MLNSTHSPTSSIKHLQSPRNHKMANPSPHCPRALSSTRMASRKCSTPVRPVYTPRSYLHILFLTSRSSCRTCTSISSWRALTKQQSQTSTNTTTSSSTSTIPTQGITSRSTTQPTEIPPDCPPDVEQLGRSTWTLLHTMAATYPEKATAQHQEDMQGFLKFFSKLYPCWVCADDFRTWMAHPSGRNQPKLSGRKEFGWWMCEAHNEVNRKLGKKEFDCRLWEERWRTGWKDGRCD